MDNENEIDDDDKIIRWTEKAKRPRISRGAVICIHYTNNEILVIALLVKINKIIYFDLNGKAYVVKIIYSCSVFLARQTCNILNFSFVCVD